MCSRPKLNSQQNMAEISLEISVCYFNDNCGVSDFHEYEEYVHGIHGHKTSSEHGGNREEEEERKTEMKGISFICSGGKALLDLHAVVYLWCSKYAVDKLYALLS